MICAHRAALDGIQMDEIDPAIVIQRIEEAAPKETIQTAALAMGGSRITQKRRESLDVVVRFAIDVRKREMARREEIIEQVNRWAMRGGILRISQKPARRLRVILAQAASVGDPWDWTANYSLTFRACGIPWWEQETPATATGPVAASGSIGIQAEGSAETFAEATLENMSGANISTASISIGGNAMQFSDLGLGGGERLVIDHDERGFLRIRIRNAGGTFRSAMAKRSGADDFKVLPGAVSCSWSAQRAVQATVSVRGRFA